MVGLYKGEKMQFNEIFGNSKFISATDDYLYPYIRSSFSVDDEIESATLYITTLGFCEIYLSGKKVNKDLYVSTYSQYNRFSVEGVGNGELAYFTDELDYTIYASEFDVKNFIKKGKNALGIIIAGGWYNTQKDKHGGYRNYGKPKTCFRLVIKTANGKTFEILSGENDKWTESFLIKAGIFHEEQDERMEITNFSEPDFDDSGWKSVATHQPLSAKYFMLDCPANKITGYEKAILVKQTETEKVYALDKNITGYPIIKGQSEAGDVITVLHGEVLERNNTVEEFHAFDQRSSFISDGREQHNLRFTWHGFQYFSIKTTGDISKLYCEECAFVRADINNTSEFSCNDEIINFVYDAYVLTQLENYQCGVPCDCPQIERKGYTGDGQLLGEVGMLLFDSKKLYSKWLNDIADVQDRKTGYVDYTAPSFCGCSGGPGGWSSAIINSPYQFYTRFGEKEVLEKYYPNMVKFIEFMDSESIDDLVDIHKRKCSCLGDWSGPFWGKTYVNVIHPPFVNSVLYVKALKNLITIARVLGFEQDIPKYEERIERIKKAIDKKYFNSKTGNYCNNKYGTNAYALSIGLGDERTARNLYKRYKRLKGFDTGIIATKILPGELFKLGYADTAVSLYNSKNKSSFYSWKKDGATTLYENWLNPRSHNHPMFGACVIWLFEYVLGIRQKEGKVGYTDIIINPVKSKALTRVKGSITVEKGKIGVSYVRVKGVTEFTVEIPEGINAEFIFEGQSVELKAGVNNFKIKS